MKKFALIILSYKFFLIQLIGQITITHNDLPSFGTPIIQYLDTLPPTYNFFQSDTNFFWNPGMLNKHDTILYVIKDPTTDGNYPIFPNSDIMFHIPNCCAYFVDSTGSILRILGFVDSISFSQPFHIVFNGADTILPLPFNYGTTYTSSYRFDKKIYYGQMVGPFLADSARMKRLSSSSSEVSGWGTLVHPGGALDVLQEIKVIHEIDSFWIRLHAWGVWVLAKISSGTRHEINFYTLGYGLPIMQANYGYNSTLKNVRWLHTPTTLTSETSNQLFFVHPNPANDVIYIKNIKGDVTQINIFDKNGKLLLSESVEINKPININSLSPGIYLLQLINNNKVIATLKLLKK